ncbi:MAG: ATP-binding cassette domain-containing protein, partial [Dehalococcoidia bacterium]
MPVGTPTITIGRDADNTVMLPSPQVSRHHARADLTDGGWVLTDLGSTNGSFVNGRNVKQSPIVAGDVVVIGPYRLRLDGGRIGVERETEIRIEAFGLTRAVGSGARRRTILDDVSVVLAPGELVAVIGGTGAGKSTLLRALTGIEPASHGEVLVNGVPLYRNFDALRGQFGYVPQQDILHQNLPLGAALDYAAELRMPADTTPAERAHRVAACLDRLGLAGQRQTLVARLSGGERKRASIAMELLTEPRLLYLDEPTSSLDPKYDREVMRDLRDLAHDGHTILLITHRTSNLIGTADKLLVLARGGKLAYFGPPDRALEYFRAAGSRLMQEWSAYAEAIRRENIQPQQFDDIYSILEPPRWPDEQMSDLAARWQQLFREHPTYAAEVVSRQRFQPDAALPAPHATRNTAQERAAAFRQFKILSRRYVSVLINDRRNLLVLLLQAPVLALLLTLLFRADNFLPICPTGAPDCVRVGPPVAGVKTIGFANQNAAQAQQFAFVLGAIAVWLGTLNAIREVAKEDDIYRRERLINLRVTPYIASKLVVLVGVAALQVAAVVAIEAASISPFHGVGQLVGTWWVLLLAAATGTAGALAVSAASANQDRAMLMAPLLVIPQILFGGVFKPVKEFPAAVQILPALAAARWAFEGVGRMIDTERLIGSPQGFANVDALTGSPLLPMVALVVLFGAFAVAACVVQARKGA